MRGGHDVAGVPPTAGRRDRRLRLLHGRDRLAAAPVRAVLLRAGHSGGPRGRGDCQPSRRLASSSRPATCCWCWESGECAWGAQLGSPAHPGALGDRPPDALTPLAGVLLDLCWILLPAAVVRFRYASVVVVRALVMSGTTIMDKPLPALRALMGPIQVCRQTTGLDQRPECDHAAGDRCGTVGRRRPGFPSDFPPPNMGLRETGRNGRGRPVTAEAVDRPFVHVTSDDRDQEGMRGDTRGDSGATCKIAGIAYTGSNPVPATLPLSCGNSVPA